uniref:Uncharacterized protein n=1 Tax=Oryza sativa subsp. japonica TaxID=39947 RepID=Q7XIA6_ORYSJ|nr:hypothetical protein [Oryza sativa Japonica Group]BAD30481.1 hypothetical protein [Oryza sativa Japonica Group]
MADGSKRDRFSLGPRKRKETSARSPRHGWLCRFGNRPWGSAGARELRGEGMGSRVRGQTTWATAGAARLLLCVQALESSEGTEGGRGVGPREEGGKRRGRKEALAMPIWGGREMGAGGAASGFWTDASGAARARMLARGAGRGAGGAAWQGAGPDGAGTGSK